MANEARWNSELVIKKASGDGYTNYASAPSSNVNYATVTGDRGPTPGVFAVTTSGTNVDLSQLTTPGLCRMRNEGASVITYGIWDGVEFYPLGELQPGEAYTIRLSRFLSRSIGTGSGSTGYDGTTYRFRMKAYLAAGQVKVEAFEA